MTELDEPAIFNAARRIDAPDARRTLIQKGPNMITRLRPWMLTCLLASTVLALASLAPTVARAQAFNVYVTDFYGPEFGGPGGIVEFDGTTGAFVQRFAQGSSGAGLAVDRRAGERRGWPQRDRR
jgi:hypothetical protein